MRLFRFPPLALQHVEAALASLERDVESYPSLFGSTDERSLVVLVASPDSKVPEIVRGLLDSRRGAA